MKEFKLQKINDLQWMRFASPFWGFSFKIKYNKLFQQFELKSVDGSAANLMGTLEFVWAHFAPPWNLSLIRSCPFFLLAIKYGKKGH